MIPNGIFLNYQPPDGLLTYYVKRIIIKKKAILVPTPVLITPRGILSN